MQCDGCLLVLSFDFKNSMCAGVPCISETLLCGILIQTNLLYTYLIVAYIAKKINEFI